MQENYNPEVENDSEQVTISNKKGFLYPLIAIVAIVVLIVGSMVVFYNRSNLPASKFTKYMESNGYTVTEVQGITHNYLQATKENHTVQFFFDNDQKITDKHYKRNVRRIKKYYKNYEQTEDRILGSDTEIFDLVSRNGKSYLFTQNSIVEYDELNRIFEELGY